MEDKMFELMTKMYAQMQAMNDKMDTKFAEVKEEITEIKADVKSVKQDIVRLENKMDEKFGALFDGHTQHEDRLERLETKVDKVIDNYDRQDVKIEVIHTRAK